MDSSKETPPKKENPTLKSTSPSSGNGVIKVEMVTDKPMTMDQILQMLITGAETNFEAKNADGTNMYRKDILPIGATCMGTLLILEKAPDNKNEDNPNLQPSSSGDSRKEVSSTQECFLSPKEEYFLLTDKDLMVVEKVVPAPAEDPLSSDDDAVSSSSEYEEVASPDEGISSGNDDEENGDDLMDDAMEYADGVDDIPDSTTDEELAL